jgi:tetratricopeptide (TPR) repeat protein
LLKDTEKALEYALKAVEQFPGNTDALKALADVYQKNKQYQESIDTVHRIIEIDPDADAWYLLSQNYLLMGDTDKALEYAFKALELDDKHIPARIGIADTYLTLGKYKEAIAQFEIAFTHNDNLLTSLNDVAWLQASQKDPEVFSPVSALRYAEQAAALLDRTPADKEKQAQVLDTLAVALAANGKFKEAVATATQAYELSIKQDKPAFADRIKRRIELYEQEKAYRE